MKKSAPADHATQAKTSQLYPAAQLVSEPNILDHRPESATQRKLQSMMGNSPQTMQHKARIQILNQHNTTPLQRQEDDEPLQAQGQEETSAPAQEMAAPKPNNTGLPDALKSGVESLSGMSLDHVKVHYNSAQPANLNAHAYAQGSDIHVAPGQERHLPHEAWHVVQQAQGRVKPTMQMKTAAINDDVSLENEADVMGAQALSVGHVDAGATDAAPSVQRAAVTQLATPEEELEAWRVADHAHMNMPLDMGHITGNILKKVILRAKYSDAVERARMDELASEKAHLIEQNMYGHGTIGTVMHGIDTASRIMHLIGSIASMVALAANIAAFFAPAALPVGAIAGVIALAAHSAMAVLQGILIGRNMYRIRGLPEPEKAKILPTLYRDIAKLGFALLGVATGGAALGGAMHGGGLMAQHALKGAEAAAHGGHMAGEIAGETIGTYGMAATIFAQNEKEIAIGMAGGLDHHAPAAAATTGTPPPPPPQAPDDLAEVMQSDIDVSSAAMLNMSTASQDALSGADSLSSEIAPLQTLSDALPQAQQSIASLQGGEESVASMPEIDQGALEAQAAQVERVETTLGLPKTADDEEDAQAQASSRTPVAQQQAIGTAQMQPVQRIGDDKPGLFDRAVNWFKRKFSSFKKRVKKVYQGIQAKLTELVLKMAGVKDLPLQINTGAAEKRIEAQQVMGAVADGQGALGEWKSAADQIGAQK